MNKIHSLRGQTGLPSWSPPSLVLWWLHEVHLSPCPCISLPIRLLLALAVLALLVLCPVCDSHWEKWIQWCRLVNLSQCPGMSSICQSEIRMGWLSFLQYFRKKRWGHILLYPVLTPCESPNPFKKNMKLRSKVTTRDKSLSWLFLSEPMRRTWTWICYPNMIKWKQGGPFHDICFVVNYLINFEQYNCDKVQHKRVDMFQVWLLLYFMAMKQHCST